MKIILGLAVSVFFLSCHTTTNDESNSDLEGRRSRRSPGNTSAAANVAGFDFTGFHTATGLPQGTACPQRATAETDACIAAGGNSRYKADCRILCSVPIAPAGKVVGFNFTGVRIEDELPPNGACPLRATAETDACIAANGKNLFAKSCAPLCSLPIAPEGKIAGYNRTGFQVVDALPPNSACPQRATVDTDACLAAGGRNLYQASCAALCSVPYAVP